MVRHPLLQANLYHEEDRCHCRQLMQLPNLALHRYDQHPLPHLRRKLYHAQQQIEMVYQH